MWTELRLMLPGWCLEEVDLVLYNSIGLHFVKQNFEIVSGCICL